MKLNAYSIHDAQVSAFAQPFFSPTHGSALRAFSDHVNDGNSAPNKHPGDFSIYHLGTYEDSTGDLVAIKPTRIGTALEYLKKE